MHSSKDMFSGGIIIAHFDIKNIATSFVILFNHVRSTYIKRTTAEFNISYQVRLI